MKNKINKETLNLLWELFKEYCQKGLETANHKGENRIELFLSWLEEYVY